MLDANTTVATVPTDAEWNSEQRSYWLRVAEGYNGLYQSRWALRENAHVQRALHVVQPLESPVVLDVAAGTGLGRDLVHKVNPGAIYLGVDISPAMLKEAHKPFPSAVAAMDMLPIRGNSVDVVLCLFTSVSFAADVSRFLAEVQRVLVPGGFAYLSVLSSSALSLRRGGATPDRYRTRGDHDHGSVPVHRLSQREVSALLHQAGLTSLRVEPLNALSGVKEMDSLWRLGRLAARVRPRWSHSLEITAVKPSGGFQADD